MIESAGRSQGSTDLRDVVYRESNPRTQPTLVSATQIASLIEFANQRLEVITLQAGEAAIAGDTTNERLLAVLAPFIEEAAHLRYVREFLNDHSSGSVLGR